MDFDEDLPLPQLMSREEFVDYPNLAPKLAKLNDWLLDDQTATGNSAYKKYEDQKVASGMFFLASALNQGPGAKDGTTSTELARTAWSIVDEQIFKDANHRTATLAILDYLASVGVVYTRNPVRIYWTLADSKGKPKEEVVAALSKEIHTSTYKPEGGVTDERRLEYALAVKACKDTWDKIEEIHKAFKEAGTDRDKKTAVLRAAKRKDLYIYELYVLKKIPFPIKKKD